MTLKATIDDVAPPGWLELGGGFRYCAQIDVTAADAITWSPIFTYEADVSGLTFLDPANLDRRVLYYDGASFSEIDSDVRDIGMGLQVYFPARVSLAAAASDTTSYWLFWNSTTAFATKTNRDNIFLLWDECNTKTGWTDYDGNFNVVGGEFVNTTGGAMDITLRDDEPGIDIVAFCKFNRIIVPGNARFLFRVEGDFGGAVFKANSWSVLTNNTGGGRFELAWFNVAGGSGNVDWIPYIHAPNSDHRVKIKAVGNNLEGWISPEGTPISGVADVSAVNALFNTLGAVGFGARLCNTSEYDDLYVLKAVITDPTVTLAATQNVTDLMPKNITGALEE